MKEKIKAALVNKYKNLGFGDKAIEGMLAYLETQVTTEDQIEAAVNAVEGMMKAFQSEVDTRVSTAVAKAKPPTPDPTKPEGSQKEEPQTPPADMPEWAKTMLTSVQTLATEVVAMKSGKTAESRKSQLETALKDAPEAYRNTMLKAFDRMKFDKDDDFTTYLDEVKTDSAAFIQTEANSGLSQTGRPVVPTVVDKTKQASKEELDSVMAGLNV